MTIQNLTTQQKLELAYELVQNVLKDVNLADSVCHHAEDAASGLEDALAAMSVLTDAQDEAIGTDMRLAEIRHFTLTGAQLGVR